MKLWLVIFVLLGIMGGGAWLYHTTTQEKIEALVANNATLKGNVQTLTDANEQTLRTIDQLQDNFSQVQENYTRLETQFQEIRSQNNLLSDKLESSDLGELAAARPELIERIINNASGEAMRCFEILSGSPLTREERNARNANEFNSECPFLWEPIP